MSGLRRGRRRGEPTDGPAVRVLRLPGARDADLRELLAGLEEEGVPALVADGPEEAVPASGADGPDADGSEADGSQAVGSEAERATTPVTENPVADLARAAHAAAAASTLRVGVALGPDAACATLPRLPADAPLLLRRAPDADALRRLGQDAARLVKIVPLTDHPTDRSPR